VWDWHLKHPHGHHFDLASRPALRHTASQTQRKESKHENGHHSLAPGRPRTQTRSQRPAGRESLSSFVEQSCGSTSITGGRSGSERGLVARDARQAGEYFTADEVLRELMKCTPAQAKPASELSGSLYQGGAERSGTTLQFLLERDLQAATQAREAIGRSNAVLQEFPFTCRKAIPNSPFLRELVIPFGAAGYVALFEIEDSETVTSLAIRHQREDDYF
jgi:hypothetical protein